jgi:hypothetical protein
MDWYKWYVRGDHYVDVVVSSPSGLFEFMTPIIRTALFFNRPLRGPEQTAGVPTQVGKLRPQANSLLGFAIDKV